MRFPSIRLVAREARATALRFPWVLVAAAVATVAAIALTNAPLHRDFWHGLLATGTLGLPLFTALTLWAERTAWSRERRAAVQAAGALPLAAFFALWPGWSHPVQSLRFVEGAVALHLLVAFLPYLRRDDANGFWQYNRVLLERFLTAAVYSVTVFAGLSVALLGVDHLLGIHVDAEAYLQLWAVIAFGFNTWFFLAGVPKDFAALNRDTTYPTRLKAFTQFVLVPLVTVYLAILTVYLGKVVVTRQWPSGWIGYLVSSVAVVGILSLLLVHPVADREENRWISTYARWFYIALVPSIVMLILAIWKRIGQYGVTEKRYFLVVLTLWLAGIAIYYGWTRSRNIRIIPVSLSVLALVTFAGPWSAYRVSAASQRGRLGGILRRNAMLEQGALRPASTPVSVKDRREISAILVYLIRTHGTGGLAAWFPEPLAAIDTVARSLAAAPSRYVAEQRAELLARWMGIDYVPRGGTDQRWVYFRSSPDSASAVRVTGFDWAVDVSNLSAVSQTIDGVGAAIDTAGAAIVVWSGADTVALSLEPVVSAARTWDPSAAPTAAPMHLAAEHGSLRAEASIQWLQGTWDGERIRELLLKGILLIAR